MIQAPSQLREVYGANNAETMMKSLAARIVFAPKDYADAAEISSELGNTTVKVRSVSKGLFDPGAPNARARRSENVSEQRRPLLLPQEVKELGKEDAIVFFEGLRPIRCEKIRYYADPRFQKRLCKAPEDPAPIALVVAHAPAPEIKETSPIEREVVPPEPSQQNPTGVLRSEDLERAAEEFLASLRS